MGFAGIVAPHALTAGGVEKIAKACLYVGGVRGFSNSPRAGRYGATSMQQHLAQSDREAVVVCQIEDAAAIASLATLVRVEEVDCFLIGRADLALSLGVHDLLDPHVVSAVDATIRACVEAGKAVGIFVGTPSEIPALAKAGATFFVVGSDQSMLRQQTAAIASRIADLKRDLQRAAGEPCS